MSEGIKHSNNGSGTPHAPAHYGALVWDLPIHRSFHARVSVQGPQTLNHKSIN